jgi:hypothetical protein
MSRLAMLVPILPALLGACSEVGLREPKTQDTVVQTHRKVVDAGARARVEADGAKLTVIATRRCAVRETREVDRTVTQERFNKTPETDWIAGVTGVITGGVGASFIALHQNFPPDSSGTTGTGTQSTGNSGTFTQNTAVSLGAGLAGIGLALVAIPIVDAMRSSGSVETVSRIEVDGGIVGPVSQCPEGPTVASQQAVMGRLRGPVPVDLPLGQTGDDGSLHVDLADAIPVRTVASADGHRMSIMLNGIEAGSVDLAPVLAEQENRAWIAVDLEPCATTGAFDACGQLRRYLSQFPSGPHAGTVRTALDRADAVSLQRQLAEARRRADDEAAAKASAAAAQAKAAAAAACRQKCVAGCRGVAACTGQCVAQSCH